MKRMVIALVLACLFGGIAGAQILMGDFGFENQTGAEPAAPWQVYKSSPFFTHIIENAGKAHTGNVNAALSITADATAFQWVDIAQWLRLVPGREYLVTCWIFWEKPENIDSCGVGFYTWNQDLNKWYGTTHIIKTREWIQLSYTFTAEGTVDTWNKVYVSLNAQNQAVQIRIDDFVMVRNGNVMGDYGFETQVPGDVLAPWQAYKSSPFFTHMIEKADKQNSGYVNAYMGITSDAAQFFWVDIAQWLNLDVGSEYEASAWVNWEDAAAGDSVMVGFYTWNQDLNKWYGKTETIKEAGYKEYTYTFTAEGTAATWNKIYVSLNAQNKTFTVKLDDFGLYKLPGGTGVGDDPVRLPAEYGLHQNYPNPFNPTTTISFSLPESGPVRLLIYDITGRIVSTLADRMMAAGEHAVQWNGMDASGNKAPTGIYFYRIEAGQYTATKKLTLIK